MNITKHSDVENYFNHLPFPDFKEDGLVWDKRESMVPIKNFKNKFTFYKIGKMFGMFTQRVLAVQDGKLFYYDVDFD
jgi:hypothetical protein